MWYDDDSIKCLRKNCMYGAILISETNSGPVLNKNKIFCLEITEYFECNKKFFCDFCSSLKLDLNETRSAYIDGTIRHVRACLCWSVFKKFKGF